ncbi:hypothetical protein BCR43DRAFT_91095 [Syncephalastrum racemosum]|uniref:UBA domain-containing protein n=1 Tax=Syncephalastrum racemosum TaxID=13706 RepID=A0A1X2H3S7_SYNRA|nr:hypothetical protein BCR43DRAFT_91095 [Syncephalastrum racemosum]
MGFKDDERNRQVLRQTQGSLEAAIDILSRLPGAQRPPLTNGIGLTDEQKMLRLNDLGYTDMAECRDALRRTGGNLEVAISLLQNARQSATTAQPSKPAEPLSAFSTTSAFSTSQELAGRAQNSEERQAAKLSGTPMGKLLDVDDASRAVPNVSNPFNMPLQQQQQQQQPQPQPQSSFTTTNPFGQSTPFAMMMSSSSATTTMQQPQLTGMPAASNGMAMFNVQPQQTGLQPHVSPMQPTMTGSSNPFSQMASSPSPLTSTPGTASSSPFQQHQQPQNDRYGLPQRSFTAPSFGTSPFPSSPLQQHHQLQQPQQQQPFQQQQHVQPQQTGMMMMNHGFANAVPAQPTGYQNVFGNMPPAATAASTNPWANGSTGGALF